MKITCPNCSTTYDVGATSIAPQGRDVRCSRCGSTWHIGNEPPDDTPPRVEIETPGNERFQARAATQAENVDRPADAGEPEHRGETGDADDAEAESWNVDDDHANTKKAADEWAAAMAEDEEEVANDGLLIDTDDGGSGVAPPLAAQEDDWETNIGLRASGSESAGAATTANEAEDTALSPAQPMDAETVAERERRRRIRRKQARVAGGYRVTPQARAAMGLILFAGSLVLALAMVTLRQPIVRAAPNLADLYAFVGLHVNLRGLEFRDLRTFREYDSGTPVLIVEGTIENVRQATSNVPAIRLSLRSSDEQEIYAWTVEPRQSRLRAGQTLRFSTRLASPPDVAADVLLRFTDRSARPTDL